LTQEELDREELEAANDVAYDGVETESALNYNSSFGKICTGE
jgi:hypothetical protein